MGTNHDLLNARWFLIYNVLAQAAQILTASYGLPLIDKSTVPIPYIRGAKFILNVKFNVSKSLHTIQGFGAVSHCHYVLQIEGANSKHNSG